jgi:hypothetical protein
MTDFINYNPMTGFSINTFRDSDGYYNDDVLGLVEDVQNGASSCCMVEGAKDALEDGSLWTDAQQEIVESIHNAIVDNENLRDFIYDLASKMGLRP